MKKVFLIIVGLIILSSIVVFVSVLQTSLHPAAEIALDIDRDIVTTITTPRLASSTPPSRLIIPSLNIDAAVEKVGINDKGNISSPKSFKTVGWYKYGPEPGSPGMAIIDGHVDNGLSLKGVFTDLKKIEVGSMITIINEEGNELNFMVQATSSLDYTSHLDDIAVDSKEKSQLILVTCDGEWIQSQKTYDKRIIVLASFVYN